LDAGGTTHWEKDRSLEEPVGAAVWRSPYRQSRSIDIEMTAYGLLIFSHLAASGRRDMSQALAIAKWIIGQRNPNGGFSSTQVEMTSLYISYHHHPYLFQTQYI